ncbi:MAG: hypothetical protein KAH06_01935 [Desulfobacterales bacterium]|nr:hypothetical protein [Desulfobacterales bacterium]
MEINLTKQKKGRPFMWLIITATITLICWWVPNILIYSSDDMIFRRRMTGNLMLLLPINFIASFIGGLSASSLFRKQRKSDEKTGRKIIILQGVLTLLAVAPLVAIIAFLIFAALTI